MTTSSEPTRLSSVSTAIQLLKSFSEEHEEWGISDLAKRLGVAKSTTHRLVTTLMAEGLLGQNPSTGRYHLSLGMFSLGALARRRLVSHEATPFLHELRQQTGETVHLAVLEGAEIMYLYNLESHQTIRMSSYIGTRKPAICTAEGRAILAFSSAEVVASVLAVPMAPRTPRTPTDKDALLRILQEARVDGYACDEEESEEGMRGIAAAVRDFNGKPRFSVGFGGPTQRLTKKAMRSHVPLLLHIANSIAHRFGFSR